MTWHPPPGRSRSPSQAAGRSPREPTLPSNLLGPGREYRYAGGVIRVIKLMLATALAVPFAAARATTPPDTTATERAPCCCCASADSCGCGCDSAPTPDDQSPDPGAVICVCVMPPVAPPKAPPRPTTNPERISYITVCDHATVAPPLDSHTARFARAHGPPVHADLIQSAILLI